MTSIVDHDDGDRIDYVSLETLACVLDVPVSEMKLLVPRFAGLDTVSKASIRRIFLAGVECRSGAVAAAVEQFEVARRPRKSIPDNVRVAVMARDGRVCAYCGKTIGMRTSFHLDHVIPYSRGGDTSVENLVVACVRCNGAKSDSAGWRDECGHLRFDSWARCQRCAQEDRVLRRSVQGSQT